MRPVVCKPKVNMTSLCLTAAPDCPNGQTKGSYCDPAFNHSRCRWIKPWKIIVRLSPDEILSKYSNVYWTSLLGLILHIHTQVELPTSTF